MDATVEPQVETVSTDPVLSDYEFTAFDRCDQCGAQAYVYVLMESGDLLFCGHHYTKHEERLSGMAVRVSDDRSRITRSSD